MKKFIYASYLKLTQEEFFELVAERMSEAYESYKGGPKLPYLEFLVYIDPNIIPGSYLDSLRRELIEEYGWRNIAIEKQSGRIYIKTEV